MHSMLRIAHDDLQGQNVLINFLLLLLHKLLNIPQNKSFCCSMNLYTPQTDNTFADTDQPLTGTCDTCEHRPTTHWNMCHVRADTDQQTANLSFLGWIPRLVGIAMGYL